MDRRNFLAATGVAAGTATLACGEGSPPAATKRRAINKPLKMHVGTQRPITTAEMLRFFKRHGVDHCCGWPPRKEGGPRRDWKPDEIAPQKDLCEKHGLSMDIIGVPFMTPPHIDKNPRAGILLGENPDRDREIEYVQELIVACAKAEVPCFKYNLRILGTMRTDPTPGGRGGSIYSTWKLGEAMKDRGPTTRAGRVDGDEFFERITYFLERVIPVCNEYKVRAACHPHDPGVPPEGFQGVDRVLGTPDGLKRFVSIQESPYHGLNLCLGTTAEMLHNPNEEIHDVIRYFGERNKIFNIHFRNIRGGRDDFLEVWPDEGDMNMVNVALTLAEVDYPYMVMPDHMPRHADDPGMKQAFAFGYGYITAVLQAIETMA